MLINFQPVFEHTITFAEFAAQYDKAALTDALNAYVDITLRLIGGVSDLEATFIPPDPDANDVYSADEAERHIGWSLVHLVVHATASVEEAAAFSSLLARGIAIGGRLRSERDWRQITSTAQAIARLEECRRICLGYLATWPEPPDLATLRILPENAHWPAPNAPGSFLVGLMHWHGHIAQFENTAEKARLQTQHERKLEPTA